ncbi:MAG: carbohydrate-binding domain-containing protein [Clostridia bacterium]|nr:carbohydrate-binding domain-containing protein [Clostridia bacterium]
MKGKMKLKEKILSLLLAGMFCLNISACGATAVEESDTPAAEPTAEITFIEINNDGAVMVSLMDGESTAEGSGVDIDGDTVTITAGGSYILSGTLTDGQVVVDADDEDVVLTLSGVSISCSDYAAIYCEKSGSLTINLEDGTENSLAVTGEYVQSDDNNVDAAVYSKSDLTFTGDGTLTIDAEFGHGIVTKDNLVIAGGVYSIDAESHGISGKDSITIINGTFDITCGEDGIHGSNDEDDTLGWVSISGGDFTIAAGDDGIHAETALTVSGGTIDITESYEGLEGKSITIEGGVISIVASDDGLNAAGGDGSAGWGDFVSDDSCYLEISGGELYVNASGDGLDSNGTLNISGGTTYVSGPTDSGNGALDYTGEGTVTGGVVVAVGSSGMAMNFDQNSTQGTILVNLASQQAAGTQITLTDSGGNVIVEYTPDKGYQSVVISAPEITSDGTYSLTVGTESYEITMSGYVYGTGTGMMGGGMQGGQDRTDRQVPTDGDFSGTRPDGGTKPDGMTVTGQTTSADTSSADILTA